MVKVDICYLHLGKSLTGAKCSVICSDPGVRYLLVMLFRPSLKEITKGHITGLQVIRILIIVKESGQSFLSGGIIAYEGIDRLTIILPSCSLPGTPGIPSVAGQLIY